MVFQHAELLPWLTALKNVEFGLEMKGMRGTALRDTAMKYLTLVGLGDSVKTGAPISSRVACSSASASPARSRSIPRCC